MASCETRWGRGVQGRGSLHDADAAVELTLGVVIDVGVGVAVADVGRRRRGAAGVIGAAVLEQDVGALLTAGSSGVRKRRLAARVATLHVHAVLCDEGITINFDRVQH